MTGYNAGDEARPWLAELVERYGEPRVHAGPVPTVIHDPSYADDRGVLVQRECWVWFPGGKNYNLALDQHKDHWTVRANAEWGKRGHAVVRIDGAGEPGAERVRAALVAARMFSAPHPERTELVKEG